MVDASHRLPLVWRMLRSHLLAALACTCSLSLFAQEAPKPENKPAEKKEEKKDAKPAESKKEDSSTTNGSVTINGKEVKYKATAAMLPILRPDNKPAAQIFHVAHTAESIS